MLERLEISEADQPLMLLVPEAEGDRFKTGKESDGFDLLQERDLVITSFQKIIGDLGAEVMNMMIPDRAGKPLQDTGQFIK